MQRHGALREGDLILGSCASCLELRMFGEAGEVG